MRISCWRAWLVAGLLLGNTLSGHGATPPAESFPRPLKEYPSAPGESIGETLQVRARTEPFNVLATALFLLAIGHTFVASRFTRMAHAFEQEHQRQLEAQQSGQAGSSAPVVQTVSFKAQVFHFLGEVEAIFGIWAVPLLIAIILAKGWPAASYYFNHRLDFTEPLFVVVIMAIAASRPIVQFAERLMATFARLGRGSVSAWWGSVLTIGPLLGSFITEPAAMTISALVLANKFYARRPGPSLAYATLGLLFVNVSVGGTLTHFAAPPVLMVAGRWGWNLAHMWTHFGWKAIVGVLAANTVYFVAFRREFHRLNSEQSALPASLESPVPLWVTGVHVLFLAWTVLNNHSPALFIGGFLFYLAFTETTEHHQDDVRLRPALLVGFFLAGLVVHGGLQGWWIEPVLSRLTEIPLFFGAVTLTAFNDNAAITYLASLVPGFSAPLKYAVVAGAVVGGGLTVIANAPNPAGQSILAKFFPDGIAAGRLFLGALCPTMIMATIFLLLGV